jgi:hypothetical protein
MSGDDIDRDVLYESLSAAGTPSWHMHRSRSWRGPWSTMARSAASRRINVDQSGALAGHDYRPDLR